MTGQDDSLKAIDKLLALPDDELKKKFDDHIETGLGKLVTDAIYGQDDKKPSREWWFVKETHSNRALTRELGDKWGGDVNVEPGPGWIHVIEKSAFDELARKLEAASRERDEWEIREQMARARNAKLVAALEDIANHKMKSIDTIYLIHQCEGYQARAKRALEENK